MKVKKNTNESNEMAANGEVMNKTMNMAMNKTMNKTMNMAMNKAMRKAAADAMNKLDAEALKLDMVKEGVSLLVSITDRMSRLNSLTEQTYLASQKISQDVVSMMDEIDANMKRMRALCVDVDALTYAISKESARLADSVDEEMQLLERAMDVAIDYTSSVLGADALECVHGGDLDDHA